MNEINIQPITKEEVKIFKETLKETSKIQEIEEETANYVKDVYSSVRRREDFLQILESELLSRIKELSPAQLTALLSNTTVNLNDAINKTLAPTATLLTEKQKTETAKIEMEANKKQAQYSQTNINELNTNAPQEVIAGMQALNQLLTNLSYIKDTKENK